MLVLENTRRLMRVTDRRKKDIISVKNDVKTNEQSNKQPRLSTSYLEESANCGYLDVYKFVFKLPHTETIRSYTTKTYYLMYISTCLWHQTAPNVGSTRTSTHKSQVILKNFEIIVRLVHKVQFFLRP